MHGDYVDHNMVQDTEIYYFDANTFDEYCDLKIDRFVGHEFTLQVYEENILPSKLVQIS